MKVYVALMQAKTLVSFIGESFLRLTLINDNILRFGCVVLGKSKRGNKEKEKEAICVVSYFSLWSKQ